MHTIKIVLVLAVLLIVVLAFRNRRSVESAPAPASLSSHSLPSRSHPSSIPTFPQVVANHLGVARGTDLILYLLVLSVPH